MKVIDGLKKKYREIQFKEFDFQVKSGAIQKYSNILSYCFFTLFLGMLGIIELVIMKTYNPAFNFWTKVAILHACMNITVIPMIFVLFLLIPKSAKYALKTPEELVEELEISDEIKTYKMVSNGFGTFLIDKKSFEYQPLFVEINRLVIFGSFVMLNLMINQTIIYYSIYVEIKSNSLYKFTQLMTGGIFLGLFVILLYWYGARNEDSWMLRKGIGGLSIKYVKNRKKVLEEMPSYSIPKLIIRETTYKEYYPNRKRIKELLESPLFVLEGKIQNKLTEDGQANNQNCMLFTNIKREKTEFIKQIIEKWLIINSLD